MLPTNLPTIQNYRSWARPKFGIPYFISSLRTSFSWVLKVQNYLLQWTRRAENFGIQNKRRTDLLIAQLEPKHESDGTKLPLRQSSTIPPKTTTLSATEVRTFRTSMPASEHRFHEFLKLRASTHQASQKNYEPKSEQDETDLLIVREPKKQKVLPESTSMKSTL